MSAPVARTPRSSGGAVQATRQQLDELDALLQRMLDLPVTPAEEPAAPFGEGEHEKALPPSVSPAPAMRTAWRPSPVAATSAGRTRMALPSEHEVGGRYKSRGRPRPWSPRSSWMSRKI